MKHIERIFDAVTGEITEVERDLTPAEIKHIANAKKENDAEAAQAEANAIAKAVAEGKLAALGLTTDDLRALGL